MGSRAGDDFDDVAIAQLGAQGHLLAIDVGRHGAVPDVAVDGIGEIHHRGPAWHGHDAALGREHVHGIWKEVDLDVVPELGSVLGFLLNVQQRLQPLRPKAVGDIAVRRRCLVQPVGGHAGFSHHIHGGGANLEFNVGAERPHQGRVQRLVSIDLGDGYVVLELAGQGFVHLVQDPHGRVALGEVVQNDAEAVEVGDLGERQVFVVHLSVDGIEGFFPPDHMRFQRVLCQRSIHLALHSGEQIFAPRS